MNGTSGNCQPTCRPHRWVIVCATLGVRAGEYIVPLLLTNVTAPPSLPIGNGLSVRKEFSHCRANRIYSWLLRFLMMDVAIYVTASKVSVVMRNLFSSGYFPP